MDVKAQLESVGNDVKAFFAKVADDTRKARQVWTRVSSPQTRALLIKIGGDAFKAVKDSTAAADAGGLNLQLDAAAVSDIKVLFDDAKAGDGVLVSDLKVLGITL